MAMNLSLAQSAFLSLVQNVKASSRVEFLQWCKEQCLPADSCSKAYFELRTIAEDIKSLVPSEEAIFPSEQINHANIGNQPIRNNEPILHVDSFLFEDEHIDSLVDEGKMSRMYCKNCGSYDVKPITFVSHSASVQRIEYIFQYMLPDLKGKVLLDVGSRLGAILYGAYYCSSAAKIIGVEINEDLCKLQKSIVEKYKLGNRIQVICDNICNIPEVISNADVILLNNVFECFMSMEEQEKTWRWLRSVITTPGTLLVTVPSMEETLSSLQTGIDLDSWLEKVPVTESEEILKLDDPDLLSEICCYVVKDNKDT